MSHPSDTLGFRPPQFSEDLAWLPGWLQQHQIEQFDECINKLKVTNLELASKDLNFFRGNTTEGKDANLLSSEEGRYNRYHLFLSGEDSSPVGFASSPGNVLHFHLHLSSNGSSQCGPTQPLDASQNYLESNRVLPVQLIDMSVVSKVKTCSDMGLDVGGINFLPVNSTQKPIEDTSPQCPSNKKISVRPFGERYNARYLKATDITDAVELSIAASEALVLHEVVRSGLASEALPTEVVLEAALQVKKARMEWLEGTLNSPAEETDQSDSLSDLDDFTMADVYEDVGLSQSIPPHDCACDSDISQVKETPVSENQYKCVNISDAEFRAQQNEFDDISVQKQPGENLMMEIRSREDLPPESFNCERLEFDKPVLGSNICSVARYDPSALKNSEFLTKKQAVGPSMVDISSPQPRNKLIFPPHAWNSEGEDRVTYIASDRFRSRWLGGWTGQEVSASVQLKQNTKCILKCYAGETSSLSESADIAPDMNSFVQVHETESHRASESSIPFGILHDEANKGILVSQELVISSSLSLVDPLCSVVPCSISSENASPTLARNQKDKESDTEECFRSTPELGVENSCKFADRMIEFHHDDGQAMPAINDERYPVTVRRQLMSLKTYSMLPPNHVSILDGGSLYRNQPFELECDQRLVQNVACTRSSENGETSTLNGNPVATVKTQKRNYHETAGDGNVLEVQASKKRMQPLSHRACHHIQASKPFLNNSTWEKHPKLALVTENVVMFQQNKELQIIQSECKDFHDRDVPVKRRVRFSETEIPVQQNKNLQKLDSSTNNCSTVREGKKPKYSKFQSHEKSCLTNLHLKAGKRLLFQGVEFLLTGFSSQKEKAIEGQIWKQGGIVLFDIPSPNSRAKRSLRSNCYQLPIILSSKKLQTTKFLYGCAVNALMLKVEWVYNSISAGYIIPPEKYMILSNQANAEHISIGKPFCHNRNYVFERVGIMLHGKHNFCSKLAKIVKHGGGKVFKTLQWLVHSLEREKISLGAIVTGDVSRTSRHLRHCVSEQKIPMMPASWIIKSLHIGKLLPVSDRGGSSFST